MKIETIYALSTGNVKSAIATVRISGNNSVKVIKKISNINKINIRKPILTTIYKNKIHKKILDRGIVIFFKSPKSYTGEDIIEISIHGGYAVIKNLLIVLSKTNLCRLAEPGEFTKRAFENNKMDLLQAEAISDLVNAETEQQRIQALSQAEGGFSKKINLILDKVKKLLANIEASIDFTDQEIPKNLHNKIKEQNKNIIMEIENILNDNGYGERVRSGFNVAILGKPNVGKSSLLNFLASRDISIVSKIPGTTRDIIELSYDLKGLPVIFYDTAGLRKLSKGVEKIGINKAIKKSKESDINIIILSDFDEIHQYSNYKDVIFVKSKTDKDSKHMNTNNITGISVKNGNGIKILLDKLYKLLLNKNTSKDNALVSRERHRQILNESLNNLKNATKIPQIDLKAEEVKCCWNNMCKIIGSNDIDEIYDIIFRDFCIGK